MRILVATDGERHSEAALSGLLSLPLLDEVQILVTTVVPHLNLISASEPLMGGAVPIVSTEFYAKMQEEAEQIVTEVTERLAPTGAKVATTTLLGDPATQIVNAAREWNADLIVVGCRQRRGLLSWFEGSVSRDVLRSAPCPLLVVPAAYAARQRETTVTQPRRRTLAPEFAEEEVALVS